MADPVGENTFRGLALPAYGEWEQVQRNSSNTMVTLTHSTGNTGAFIVGRNSISSEFWGPGSSLRTADQFQITAAGAVQVMEGTSVAAQMSSAGFSAGQGTTASGWSIDSSGRKIGLKRNVVNVTTATSNYTAVSTLSGSLFVYSTLDTSGQNFSLPSNASSLIIGAYFDVYVSTHTASTDITITSTNHSSAAIWINRGMAADLSTALAVSPNSTNGGSIRLTAISTLLWLGEPLQYLASTYDASTDPAIDTDIVSIWSSAAVMV